MTSLAKAPASGGGSQAEDHPVYKHAIDELRKSLTCTICLRLLHEPFTTSCGHTFCYECLDRWFTENKKSKSCPDCRARIREKPAQAFKIREMVSVLCKDERLLPTGESVEEHQKMSDEMTSLVETHRKAESGLFQGAFKAGGLPHAIYEPHDDVWRCPNCLVELEDLCCPDCDIEFDFDGHPLSDLEDPDPNDFPSNTDADFSSTAGSERSRQFDAQFARMARRSQEGHHARPSQFAGALEFHRSLLAEQRRFMRSSVRDAVDALTNASPAGDNYYDIEDSEFDDGSSSESRDYISDLIDDEAEEEEDSTSSEEDTLEDIISRRDRHRVSDLMPTGTGIANDTEEGSASEYETEALDVGPANFSDLDEGNDEDTDDTSANGDYYGDEDGDEDADIQQRWNTNPRPQPRRPLLSSEYDDENENEESEGSEDEEDDYGEINETREQDEEDEEDEEEQEQEALDADEDDDDDGSKPNSSVLQSLRKRTHVVLSDDDSDGDDDDDIRPPNSKRSRQTSPQPAATASTASVAPWRSAASAATLRAAAPVSSDNNEESDEDNEPIQPGRAHRRRTGRSRYSSSILGRYEPSSRGRRPFSVRA